MRYLRARLLADGAGRGAGEGGGERGDRRSERESASEKIRTYNFPDGRVTDHRIKHTSHQLQDVLVGGEELDGFVDPLRSAERADQLARRRRAGLSRCDPRRSSAGRATTWRRHGVQSPLTTAEVLLAHILGTDRAGLYARDEGLSAAEAKRFGRALCRRASGYRCSI